MMRRWREWGGGEERRRGESKIERGREKMSEHRGFEREVIDLLLMASRKGRAGC